MGCLRVDAEGVGSCFGGWVWWECCDEGWEGGADEAEDEEGLDEEGAVEDYENWDHHFGGG